MKTAFPQYKGTTQIRLYSNIPFDNSYSNHSLISELFKYNGSSIFSGTGMACEKFIDRKRNVPGSPMYYPRYDITGEFNFDYANGLLTSVVLELSPAQTNANYMRVKSHDTNGAEYYYYFITGITQINVDTYKLSLELDVLMTYQDEMLNGLVDIPIFSERKHCHRSVTSSGTTFPLCADYKSGDPAFDGVKPTNLFKKIDLSFYNTQINSIKDIVWLYICCDGVEDSGYLAYKSNGICYPMSMLCLPLNVENFVVQATNGYPDTLNVTKSDIETCINKYLINKGDMYGAKISNYPPFTSPSTGQIVYDPSTKTLTISANFEVLSSPTGLWGFTIGNNKLACVTEDMNDNMFDAMEKGCLAILEQNDMVYDYQSVSLIETPLSAPDITKNRYDDPKLLFSPFRKYVLTAKYTSDGCEVYPELFYSTGIRASTGIFKFSTIYTGYIGDYNVFTYLNEINYTYGGSKQYYCYSNYKYQKIGLASNMNYTMPVGTDALAVFNATQSASFYTSKTASGITSGITMAGGVASMIIGAVGLAGSGATGGMSGVAGAGLIAGGVSALASGTASLANTIKSTQAKMIDLKNTPDSINVSGSNFVSDTATISNTTPYIICYECLPVIKEQANDYFYNYGYQVARDCYFNLELKYTPEEYKVDNNIFGRTIFNYVQTNDDFTNKINADIPIIVKQKIVNIFNKGITLWTFFGFNSIWGSTTPSATYDIDKWFMKHTYENTEYNGSTFS